MEICIGLCISSSRPSGPRLHSLIGASQDLSSASDRTALEAKQINTLSVYDGHRVGVGRVLTDLSFHHFLDLNLIGDPCATDVKTQGFDAGLRADMSSFFRTCDFWLANPSYCKS